jgi:hypothetical protein
MSRHCCLLCLPRPSPTRVHINAGASMFSYGVLRKRYLTTPSTVVGRRSVGALVIVAPIRMMFAPPMPAPLVLAPLAPAPCALPPAIVLPPICTIAIPPVVGTRRSGAQSRSEYGGSSEKKFRSAHGSLPQLGLATLPKRNGAVAYSKVAEILKEQRRSVGSLG